MRKRCRSQREVPFWILPLFGGLFTWLIGNAEDRIADVANKFIEYQTGMVVVVEAFDKRMLGVVTLHDILRAQAALTE